MPPESLFHHTLRCPSSPSLIDLSILQSLHYPNSFKTESQLQNHPFLYQQPSDHTDELCFSVDEFGQNFFYQDCPGVVCYPEQDNTKATFTLPRVLSFQCANFVSTSNEKKVHHSNGFLGKFLPSELWGLRGEMELWTDYPNSYSGVVFRGVLGLQVVEESNLLKWVISNSPRYGIVIDVPMRDHIFLLLRLCLRAISSEAYTFSELNPMPLTFNCPVLIEVIRWLASQLSVLYGEVNGKFFSIEMLKHSILNAASSLLLFSSEQKETGSMEEAEMIGNVKMEQKKTEPCGKENLSAAKNAMGGLIYVSQVAAAVAALHERYLLEEKIRGLWLAGSLSKSQLLREHSYVTRKASEERRKRFNYRPILEHDGLLWHRSSNQDLNKNKTKEELLAEERDFKRRSMSYRGKKAKRSITEVMRDIIEVHMDEIKQAGGIGCFVKGSAETGTFTPGSAYVHDDTIAEDDSKRNECDPSEGARKSLGYTKQSLLHYNDISMRSAESPLKDQRIMNSALNDSHHQQRQESHDRHESVEDHLRNIKHEKREHGPLEEHPRSNRKEKREQEYRASSKSYRSRGQSNERHRSQSKYNETEVTDSKYDKSSSASQKYHESRYSSSVSMSSTHSTHRKHDRVSESKDHHRERMYGTRRSESARHPMFADRYDPSASDSRFEDPSDDESSGSKYYRLDKYGLNDVKDAEVRQTDYTTKGHHHSHHKF